MGKIATVDRRRITVSSMPGIVWDTSGGVGASRDVSKARRGAGMPQENTGSRQTHNNVTLTALLDPAEHRAVLARLEQDDQFLNTALTFVDLDADDVPISGSRVTRTGCMVVSWGLTDSDANGTDNQKLTVEWAVGSVTR